MDTPNSEGPPDGSLSRSHSLTRAQRIEKARTLKRHKKTEKELEGDPSNPVFYWRAIKVLKKKKLGYVKRIVDVLGIDIVLKLLNKTVCRSEQASPSRKKRLEDIRLLIPMEPRNFPGLEKRDTRGRSKLNRKEDDSPVLRQAANSVGSTQSYMGKISLTGTPQSCSKQHSKGEDFTPRIGTSPVRSRSTMQRRQMLRKRV